MKNIVEFAINANFYNRADLVFYQKSGVNWDLRVVNESYKWVEKAIVFSRLCSNSFILVPRPI